MVLHYLACREPSCLCFLDGTENGCPHQKDKQKSQPGCYIQLQWMSSSNTDWPCLVLKANVVTLKGQVRTKEKGFQTGMSSQPWSHYNFMGVAKITLRNL